MVASEDVSRRDPDRAALPGTPDAMDRHALRAAWSTDRDRDRPLTAPA